MSDNTHIIAIAGPSCAGKTETAKAVARLLNSHILGLDAYYHSLADRSFEQRKQFNFDAPASIDHDYLIGQLHDVREGKRIEAPVYDYVSYTRAEAFDVIQPAPFLILEGLFALWWKDVRDLCDTTVYVHAPDDVCLERRKYRDVRERGRTVESVLKQYNETVRPMAAKYVWPTKDLAEIVVSGTDSLQHCAEQILQAVSKKLGQSLPVFSMTK